MSDYKSYSCSNLLEYLDECYKIDTEDINYAQYLLDMLKTNSIKEIIEIYDKILRKLLILSDGEGDEKMVSETWYDMSQISIGAKDYWQELNTFLNENIERLFFMPDYDDNLAIACAINLRKANNYSKIRQSVLANSTERVSAVVKILENKLCVINDASNHISSNSVDINNYKSLYIKNINILIKYGFERSIKEKTFESNNRIKTNKPNNSQRNKKIIKNVAIIGGIIVLFILYFLFVTSGGLFGLIILIGLPGALVSYLKSR